LQLYRRDSKNRYTIFLGPWQSAKQKRK
jgi:hypothetical protein